MKTRPRFVALLLSTLALVSGPLAFEGLATSEWPQFLGPDGMASAPDQRIPDQFGPDRNVTWKKEVPLGHSSPIISGGRVILTSAEGSTVSVICLSRADGSTLWRKDLEMKGSEPNQHRHADPAAPTPCTDGERIYAYFGAYGLIALDMEGKVLWERAFPVAPNMFGTGTSPILHDGAVILLRDIAGISGLYCIDGATGEDRWKTARPEAQLNYGSPFVWKNSKREEIVVAGTGILKSYDPKTGKPLWWVKNITSFVCTTPIATPETLYFAGWSTGNVAPENRLATGFDDTSGLPENVLTDVDAFIAHFDKNEDGSLQPDELPPGRATEGFELMDFNRNGSWEKPEIQGFASFPSPPGKNNVIGVRAGGDGDITKSHVIFEKTKGVPYVASPLLHKGRLYYAKKGGIMSCIDPKSGKPFYEAKRLGVGGEYYSSPVGVGDRVLVGTVRGTLFVLGTGDELEIVARHDFGEGIFATPAVVDNVLYLRTTGHLYAIADDKARAQR